LQKLLGDIDAGRVDVVVVYKVDRLTRSLLDFAHIVQRLKDKGVSFVSVTQSFNTTSSMGRLTLNVLLSFAQFEREVTGERMIATHSQKGGRLYRYYISASLMNKKPDFTKGWRLPAREIEAIVSGSILGFLKDPVRFGQVLGVERMTANVMNAVSNGCDRLGRAIEGATKAKALEKLKAILHPLIRRVDVSLYEVGIVLDPIKLNESLGGVETAAMDWQPVEAGRESKTDHHITVPVQLKRRGVEMRMVVTVKTQETTEADQELQKLVAKAHYWFEDLKTGKAKSVSAIAQSEGLPISEVSRTLPLAFLAPDIVTAILDDEHPVDLTAQKLKRLKDLPHDWEEQRRVLGFV